MCYELRDTCYPAEAGSSKHHGIKTEARKVRKLCGFTLVESLVVFAIIGILSGIMFTRFQYTEQNAQLDYETDSMLGVLYEARALSLAGQRVGASRPNGGYGVRLETCAAPPCSYALFADTDPAQPHQSDHMFTEGGSDAVIKTVSLSARVTIDSLTPSNPTSVAFSIPESVVYVNGQSATNDVVIQLRHVDSNATRRIRVNPLSGRMNIE